MIMPLLRGGGVMPTLANKGFKLVGKWEYGQGFMDIIHAFSRFYKDKEIYEKLSSISNEIQKIIDKAGLGDFLLIVLKKE